MVRAAGDFDYFDQTLQGIKTSTSTLRLVLVKAIYRDDSSDGP